MTTKECSSCTTTNPVSANFCRRCGCRFPEHTKPGVSQKCHIDSFAVTTQSNGKFLVEWNAVNADKVIINGQDVTGLNKLVVTVRGSQTILLRAENATSFDIKESNVVYDSQIIYKDKIVEKKVISRVNITLKKILILFIAISAISIYYAYQLEDANYKGRRYLSEVFGYKPYLWVNGADTCRMVHIKANGESVKFDIKTNASEYEILDLPNWCTLNKNDSTFTIMATKNTQSDRTAAVRVKTNDNEIIISLIQAKYKPQRLLVNNRKVVNSNLSASSGRITYQVSTDADNYDITSLSPWFKVIAKGPNSFTIKYEENTSMDLERKGKFKVNAGGMEVSINLIQTYAKKITGQIKDVTVEHNVIKDGVVGMKILLDLSVQNMKGIEGVCAVYFYYQDGRTVKDKNQRYYTNSGDAAAHTIINPIYDSSLYTDLEIFMPYNELEVGPGKHDLKFYCIVWERSSSQSNIVAQSQYYHFTLTNN